LVAGFEVELDDVVFVPHTAEVLETEYRRNTFVVLRTGMETDDNLPVFGKITDIVVIHSSDVVLVVNTWTTVKFEESLRSFVVQDNQAAENRKTLVGTPTSIFARELDSSSRHKSSNNGGMATGT